jgi:putative membrane protein
MRTPILFVAAAACALSLAACQKKAETPAAADAGTSNTAVNTAQDATSAAVGAAASTTAAATNSTDAFVTGLVTGNSYEIAAGKIAEAKGQSPGVKAFGKMLVSDHTALGKSADPALKASGKPLPTELDERRKGLIDNLNAAKPADFDKEFLSQQEAAHKETLTLLKGYVDGGDDAALKAVATSAIPTVQAHLDKVHELQNAPAPKG